MNWISTRTTSFWTRASTILVIILLIAFGLRIWGIWFGLPYVFHNDEGNEVLRALQLGTGQFNFQRIDKGLYFYLLFIEYGVLFVILKVFGVVTTSSDFGEFFIRDPSAFYLIGRVTTVVIGTATVFLVYRIGRTAYTSTAALIAAGVLAVNVLHANLSHYVTVDVPLAFFTTATLYFAMQMLRSGEGRYYWLAALMAALATAAKTPGALLLIPLLVAHVFAVRNNGSGFHRYFSKSSLWQAVIIFVLVYAIANPGIVVNFEGAFWRYLGKFVGDDAGARYIADEVLDSRALFANTNLFIYYLKVMVNSMTLPLFAVCAGGIVYAVWRRQVTDIVLLSFVIPTYVILSLSNDPFQFFPRYMLPVLPIVALFGGRLMADMIEKLPSAKRSVTAGVVTIALAVLPVSKIGMANYVMTRPDTRAIAKTWIDENIEAGSRIFIEGTRTEPIQGTVPLQNSVDNIRASIANYKDIAPGKAKYFRMAIEVQVGKSYDLLTVRPIELENLEHYKNIGVRYFVVRPENYQGSRVRFHWPKLIEDLRADPDVSLIRRIETDGKIRPGPVIEIYRVNVNVGTADTRQ